MPLQSSKDEKHVIDFILRERSSLPVNEQDKNIDAYHAIKHHMPMELFESGKLKFNYNKGLSYILSCYNDILIFKIPNSENKSIEIICPADKEFINNLEISDVKKDSIIKRYRDTEASFWYVKLSSTELLRFSSAHWIGFNKLLKDISLGK